MLDRPDISAKGRAAYYALAKAERFETGFVGFAGSPSSYIENYNTITKEPAAADMFAMLFDNATTAGKLYALSGLYLTDRDAFPKAADVMKKSDEMVEVLNGCLMSDEKAAKFVESDAENVAIIRPGQTMKEFWATNAGGFELDIAHGGYPATFAEMADIKVQGRR